MPSRNKQSRRTRRRKQPPVDRELVNSIKATGSTTTTVATDLIQKRQNMNLVQSPPKQIGNQIYWLKELVTTTFNTSTTTYAENNNAFSLNQLQNYSNLTSVFDQYCIYSVAISYSVDGSAPTGVSATLLTAIDYDNVANIGPAGIEAYNNCSSTLIGPSSSLVRYVKPCLSLAAYTGTFNGYSMTRCWLDCNSPSIQHYGIRAVALTTNSVFAIRQVWELTLGFRNSF